MTVEELSAFKEEFKSIVWWKGELASRNKYIQTLSRYDKNGSHQTAILKAMNNRDEAKKILKEKLNGREYEHMMESLRKATVLANKIKKNEKYREQLNSFNPFN